MYRASRHLLPALFLLLSFGSFAQNFSLNNLAGGFFLDFFPVLDYSNSPVTTSTADEVKSLGAFYNKPTFLSGGLFFARRAGQRRGHL